MSAKKAASWLFLIFSFMKMENVMMTAF